MALTTNLDEAAALIHKVRLTRSAAVLAAGGICLLLLPWFTTAAWVATALLLEVWGVFCTRAQYSGWVVGRATRAAFAVNFVLLNLTWLLLGFLLWGTGILAAQACTAAILATVASVLLLLVYQRALTYVMAGAAPPIAVLITLAGSGHPMVAFLPTVLVLIGALLFALFLAQGVPSALAAERLVTAAQAQYRVMADSTSDVIGRIGLDGRRK